MLLPMTDLESEGSSSPQTQIRHSQAATICKQLLLSHVMVDFWILP